MENLEKFEKMYQDIYNIYETHISSTWLDVDYCEQYLENLYKIKEGLENLIELEQSH